MTVGPQATFVVEYPCDQFCRIEVELVGERDEVTLRQLREKADGLHQRVHEPESEPADAPAPDRDAARRPAATVFRAAPGRGVDRRR
ncbi:hypothetical protein [Paractinoplanes rishiriensis]|uniref:hypothetical protein n=1 Tax=Paractinoplanes rishiriensis TaxID=1050105 RepID=UPI0019409825|nr:hypothetical protein [Actinoplanes rishiriensis]